MTFEEMLKALMNGKKIRKKAWDRGIYRMRGDGKYIIDQEGNESAILIDGSFDADVWEEYKEEVLDEKEKKYLSAVIKPFRNMVVCICKLELITCNQFIHIKAKRYDEDTNYEYINLPVFRKGTMYKNMKVGKEYTLKELGL